MPITDPRLIEELEKGGVAQGGGQSASTPASTGPSVSEGLSDFGESAVVGAQQGLTQMGRGIGTLADAINQATGAFDEGAAGPGWNAEDLQNQSNYKRRKRESEAAAQREDLAGIRDSGWKTAGNITGQIAPHLAMGITGGIPGLVAGSALGGTQTTGDIMLQRAEEGRGGDDPWSAIAAGAGDTATSIATGGLLNKFGGNRLRDNILRNATEGGTTTALAEGYTNLAQDREFTENMGEAALAGALLGGGITAGVEVPSALRNVDFTNFKPTQTIGRAVNKLRGRDYNIAPDLEEAATREVMNSAELDVDIRDFREGTSDKSAEDIADAAIARETESVGYGNLVRAAELVQEAGIPLTARSLEVELPGGGTLGQALGVSPRQISEAAKATEGARAGQLFDISSKPLTAEQHRQEVQDGGRKAVEIIEQDFMNKRNQINDRLIDVRNRLENRDPDVTAAQRDRLKLLRDDMDNMIRDIKAIRSKSHSGNIDLESFQSSSRRVLGESLKVPGLELKGRDGGEWNPVRDIRDLDMIDRMLTAEYPAWKEGTPNPAKQREVDKTLTDPMRIAAGVYTGGAANAAESAARANRRRQLKARRAEQQGRITSLAELAGKARAAKGDFEGANQAGAVAADVGLNADGIETGPSVMDTPLETQVTPEVTPEVATEAPVVDPVVAPGTPGTPGTPDPMLRTPARRAPEPVEEAEEVIPGSDSEQLTGTVDRTITPEVEAPDARDQEIRDQQEVISDLQQRNIELQEQADQPAPRTEEATKEFDTAMAEAFARARREADAEAQADAETVETPEVEPRIPGSDSEEMATPVARPSAREPEAGGAEQVVTVPDEVDAPTVETEVETEVAERIPGSESADVARQAPDRTIRQPEAESEEVETELDAEIERIAGSDSEALTGRAPDRTIRQEAPEVESEADAPEVEEKSKVQRDIETEMEQSAKRIDKDRGERVEEEAPVAKPLPTVKPDGFDTKSPKVEMFRAPIQEDVEISRNKFISRLSDDFPEMSEKELSDKVLNAMHDMESNGKHVNDITEGNVKKWIKDNQELDEVEAGEKADTNVRKSVARIVRIPSVNNEFSVKQALLAEGVDAKYLDDKLIRGMVSDPSNIIDSQVQRIRKSVYDAVRADKDASDNVGFVKTISSQKGSEEQLQYAKDRAGIVEGKPVTDRQLEKFQSELATRVHKDAEAEYKKQEAEAEKLAKDLEKEMKEGDAKIDKSNLRDANQLQSIINKLEGNIRRAEGEVIKQNGVIEQADADMARISKEKGLKDLQERMTNPQYRKAQAKAKTAKALKEKAESELMTDKANLEKAKGLRNFDDAFSKMIEAEADLNSTLNFSKRLDDMGANEVAQTLNINAGDLKADIKAMVDYNPNISDEVLQKALDKRVAEISANQTKAEEAVETAREQEIEKAISEVPADEIDAVRSRLQDEVSRLADEGKRQESLRALAALNKIPTVDARKHDPRTARLLANEEKWIKEGLERKLRFPDNPEFWLPNEAYDAIDRLVGAGTTGAGSSNRGRWGQRLRRAIHGDVDAPFGNLSDHLIQERMAKVSERTLDPNALDLDSTRNIRITDEDMEDIDSFLDVVRKKAEKAKAEKEKTKKATKPRTVKGRKGAQETAKTASAPQVEPEVKQPEPTQAKTVEPVTEAPAAPEQKGITQQQLRSPAAIRRYIEEQVGYELDGSKVDTSIAKMAKSRDAGQVEAAVKALTGKQGEFGWVGKDGKVREVGKAADEVEAERLENQAKIDAALGKRAPKEEGVDKAPVSREEKPLEMEANIDETPEEAAARKETEDAARNVMKARKAALKKSTTDKARDFVKYKREMGYDDDMDVIADMPELVLTPAEYAQAIEDGRKVKDAMIPDEVTDAETSGVSETANFSSDYLNEIATKPMKMTDVMDLVSKNSENSAYRAIANRIKSALRNDFEVATESTREKYEGARGLLVDNAHVPARMVLSKRLIDKGDVKGYEDTLIHEAIHSTTSSLVNAYKDADLRKAMSPSQKDAVERYNTLNDKVVKEFKNSGNDKLVDLAMEFEENPQELLAYAMTEQGTIDALKTIKVDIGGNMSSGWDALKDVIMDFFGIKKGKLKTAFESVLDSFDELSDAQGMWSEKYISDNTDSSGLVDTKVSERHLPTRARGALTAL